MALQPAYPGGAVERPGEGTLSEVISTILDKGLVIDVYARVSLVGIEVLRADVRIVVASVDTYLRFAEAAHRLELGTTEPQGLPDLVGDVQESGAKRKTKGALEAAADRFAEFLAPHEKDEEQEAEEEEELEPAEPKRKRRRS